MTGKKKRMNPKPNRDRLTSAFRELKMRLDMAHMIVLTTHLNPDGDALGSEAAFFRILKSLGKHVSVLNISPTPESYRFLDRAGVIRHYRADEHKYLIDSCDLLICLDIGGYNRCGDIGVYADRISKPVISIDHHPSQGDYDYIQEIVDTESCSTGSILYSFIEQTCPDSLDRDTAEALYVALVTDTGNFKYSNTGSESHRIAAELLKYDIDPALVYQRTYENYSPSRMSLLGEILGDLHYECSGKLVWFMITDEMLKRHGATQEDTDGFSDIMRSIKNVEVAMMIKSRDGDSSRINWRSRGEIPMNQIARDFGGGGHPSACGATVDLPVRKAVERVLPAVVSHIEKYQE